MIIDPDPGRNRLTQAELNRVRRANAKHGHAVNEGDIRTFDGYRMAVIMDLPMDIVYKLLEFYETGSYPGMEENLARRAREQRGAERGELAVTEAEVPDELAHSRDRREPASPDG